jgi:hypothetical protein
LLFLISNSITSTFFWSLNLLNLLWLYIDEIYRDAGKFKLRDGKKPAGAADHNDKAFRPSRHTNPRYYIPAYEHK